VNFVFITRGKGNGFLATDETLIEHGCSKEFRAKITNVANEAKVSDFYRPKRKLQTNTLRCRQAVETFADFVTDAVPRCLYDWSGET
jgi:hypothetical protein